MKSPGELATRLAAQWQRPALRLARLTSAAAWPLRLPIGRPAPMRIERDPEIVRAHVHAWTKVDVGEVEWEDVCYRSTGQPVRMPIYWKILRPAQWVQAIADRKAATEYAHIGRLCASTPEIFHPIWIGKSHLWEGKSEQSVLQATRVALALNPGCAEGKSLRALSIEGTDSKFHENHRSLLVALLDARFDGAASMAGLEGFLGAEPAEEHWGLVADLSGKLLPFARQRVRTQELATISALPGTHLLVIENERCFHQLPKAVPDTLAVLGAGLDLDWLANPAFAHKRVAYWGDLDTWGLRMLGLARSACANLTALLMDAATFAAHSAGRAVPEPVPTEPPSVGGLTEAEMQLFQFLKSSARGRLEQEFLPAAAVDAAVQAWRASHPSP